MKTQPNLILCLKFERPHRLQAFGEVSHENAGFPTAFVQSYWAPCIAKRQGRRVVWIAERGPELIKTATIATAYIPALPVGSIFEPAETINPPTVGITVVRGDLNDPVKLIRRDNRATLRDSGVQAAVSRFEAIFPRAVDCDYALIWLRFSRKGSVANVLIPTWEAIRFFTCATSKLFMAVLSGDIGTQRWFCGARSNYDSIRNATHLHLGPEASQSECAVIASMVAETALRKSLLEVHKTFRFEQLSQKPSKYPLFDWPFTSIKQIEFQMSWSSRVGSSETHLVERILAIKPLRKLGKVVIEQSNQGGIAPSLSPKKYPALGQQWLPSGSQVQVTVEAGSNLAGVVNVPTSEMGNAFTSLSRIEHLEVLRKPQASSNRQGIRSDDVSFPKHTLDAVPSPHGEHGRIKLSQDQGEAIQREKLFICGTFMEIVEKASAGRGFKPATWPQVFGLEEPWKGVRITPTNQRLCKAASAYLASKCGWLYVLNKNKSDAHRTFYVAQFTDGRGGYCCVFDIEDTTPNGRFAMRVVWSRDKRALSGSLIEQLLLRQMLCRGRIPTRHLSDHGLSIANIRHAVLTIPAEVSNSEKNAVRIKYVASCAHSLGEKLAELLA